VVLWLGWTFLPFAVYFDAEYVGNSADWNPNGETWTALTVLFGILGAGGYLVKRHAELD
jgi:hypothetical protein